MPSILTTQHRHAAAQRLSVGGSVEVANAAATRPSSCASPRHSLPEQQMDAVSTFTSAQRRAAKSEHRKVSSFRFGCPNCAGVALPIRSRFRYPARASDRDGKPHGWDLILANLDCGLTRSGASRAELVQVEVEGLGFNLHWPKLDVDLYVPALVAGVFGTQDWMVKALARRAGRSTSPAKAAAARANGAKGGRPRKKLGVETRSRGDGVRETASALNASR